MVRLTKRVVPPLPHGQLSVEHVWRGKKVVFWRSVGEAGNYGRFFYFSFLRYPEEQALLNVIFHVCV